jgi:hypothetical protein
MAGPRGPVRFKQTEISRFARAVLASGMQARIELTPDGKLSAIPLNAEPSHEPAANAFDEALHAARKTHVRS